MSESGMLAIRGGLTGEVSYTDGAQTLAVTSGGSLFSLPDAREVTIGAPPQAFTFLNNLIPGQTTSNPAYQFRYAAYNLLTVEGASRLAVVQTLGFRAPPGVLPTSSRTYPAVLAGYVLPSSDLSLPKLDGTAVVRFDSANATVTVEFTPSVRYAGPAITIPPFTVTVPVDRATGRIAGGFATPRGISNGGTLIGYFYGPSAEEIGLSFVFQEASLDINSRQIVAGAVLGK